MTNFSGGASGKESACQSGRCKRLGLLLSWEHSPERRWKPTPAFLPGKSHREDPGRLPSRGSQRIRYDWACTHTQLTLGFPGSSAVEESICNAGDPWVEKIPWRRDKLLIPVFMGSRGGSDGKESACSVGDLGSVPRLGRSPEGRQGNPLQCSCLQNRMVRGAWRATVHEVAESWTQLSD